MVEMIALPDGCEMLFLYHLLPVLITSGTPQDARVTQLRDTKTAPD
jgi:hypothetical protein